MIKEKLGFTNDYIIIFKGNTYPLKDWFKAEGAKYNGLWGWAFADERSSYPEGIIPIKLYWKDISENGCLKPDYQITAHVDSLKYDPSPSTFQGEIGETIYRNLTLTKILTFSNYYDTYLYLFADEDNNVYSWTTTKRETLLEGKTYRMRGRVKDHKLYRNCQQTVINYCRVLKSL